MPPRSFYEIDPKLYLFGKNESPEEKVRQWTIFELLSNYGFSINSIRTEVQCKIGGKYFPADIVVYQEEFPLIVVECKRQDKESKDEPLKQAISYANFLKAEFAVFTNGRSWVARRQINGEWYPVADIPGRHRLASHKTITSVLWFVHNLEPVLYWTYKAVPKQHAPNFFSWLIYFYQNEVKPIGLHQDLWWGMDNLLRILGSNPGSNLGNFAIAEYEMEKIVVAYHAFGKFFDEVGIEHVFKNDDLRSYNFREILGALKHTLDKLVNAHENLAFKDALLIRMASSVTQYLWQIYQAKSYVDVQTNVTREIENFIDAISRFELGVGLPDPLDTGNCDEMKILCSEKWEKAKPTAGDSL